MKKTILNQGKLDRSTQEHEYEFPNSKDFFSLPANLITNLSGVSGGRVLLGSKASLQAISLINRQTPLVQSVSHTGEDSFVDKFGKGLLAVQAEADGKVVEVGKDHITTTHKDGKQHIYHLYDHYNLGRKSFIHHTPRVHPGDSFKKGQILATSNYTDEHGHLALGTNLKTAVMPYRSGNFEDAWVITDSGAAKMEAEQLIKYRVEKKFGIDTDKRRYTTIFPNKFLNTQLSKLDDDGVVKVGQKLHHGDPIILAFSPKPLKSSDVQLGKLSRSLANAYRDGTEIWDFEHDGEVVDVSKAGDLFTVQIKTKRGLSVGDKISNVWGAKGVVGAIIPDAQAPTTKDGKPVDIILNSMSITSRVAPGLAAALGMGKVAEKTGKPIKAPHFRQDLLINHTIDELKKHGISDTETLYDPVTGKEINVLMGPLYFTRLTHIAEDKQSGRSQGSGYSWDMQPTKTEEESSKRIGNLSTTALLSHGATAVLRDIATIKSTKNDEYWNRVKQGLPPPPPQVPFIFHKFIASMQASGINVKQHDDTFNILPMTDKDVTKMSSGPIISPGLFKAKGDKFIPEPHGLFDPIKTGILGDKWNHVDLHHKIPNPISEDFLRKLLGVTKPQFEDLISNNQIEGRLNAISLDEEIRKNKEYIKSGKASDRDKAIKLLAFLTTLKKNNMHPRELLLSKVPIMPVQFRPAMAQGDLVLSSDVNTLYKDLILVNNGLKDTQHVPEDLVKKGKVDLYKGVKAIYGLGDPIDPKSKEKGMKGILASTLGIKGGSAKASMFQAKVVNKPVDLVGRAVLTPDAKLGLDEASVPQDLLWKTYKPFVIRRMIMSGVPGIKALDYIKSRNPIAAQALMQELQSRPGIVSRDPSLHKFNLTGFYLKPNADPKDKTVKMNPLVFKSFNADNDGDQLNINVPASEEARTEILDKMLPSRNLLSPKNFAPMYMPSNEAALGLYQASTEKHNNPPKKFKTHEEVVKAFERGELNIGDLVDVG